MKEHGHICRGCVSNVENPEDNTCALLGFYYGRQNSDKFKLNDISTLENCPCINCVVKIMCKRYCHLYNEYTHEWKPKKDGW